MGGVEVVAILIFVCVVIALFYLKEQRLADPANHDMIYTSQMQSVIQFPVQRVSASLLRQSGNVYKDLGVFDTPNAALLEIEKSFRRAKIESIAVMKNTSNEFYAIRLHHSHGGKAEGKKLGGVVIQVV